MLPNQKVLEQVARKIMSIPNRKKESKRGVHYGLFLLGYQSGLRVSEAVGFDLSAKNKQGLYCITKPKGKKERFVYIPKEVIRELKKHDWQPNQTNRFNFYHFLKKVKRELNISKNTELTPHTLRRAFTTHHAESGLPLPLLQKLLGHSSIRTTALYWHNIYQAKIKVNDDDISDILAAKNWLESKRPPKPPITGKFPLKSPAPVIINIRPKTTKRPIVKEIPPPLLELKPVIKPKSQEMKIMETLTSQQKEIGQQLPLITNHGKPPTAQELILLTKIKHLEEQLRKVQALAQTEKKRADQAEQQLRKISYYQQLEQERTKNEAKIIQSPSSK